MINKPKNFHPHRWRSLPNPTYGTYLPTYLYAFTLMVQKDAADPVHERSIPDFQTRHSADTLCVDFIREAAKIVCIPKVR